MHIVYASDNNFAEVMGVSILSLFENNKNIEEIVIYILDSGVDQQNKERINDVFEKYNRFSPIWIKATNINQVLGIEVKQDRGSLSQFARLFISSVVPQDINRVLYLDCDVIVDGSLESLWSMDMDGAIVAALQDAFSPLYRKNLGLEHNDTLFNSGVMLIDLKRWKENRTESKILKLIKKYDGKIPQGDQGALNAILSRDIILLNPIYNLVTIFYDFSYEDMLIYRKPPKFYGKEQIEYALNNPVIIHFTSSFLSRRPWIKGSNHPYTSKWREYKSISPWEHEPLKEFTNNKWRDLYVNLYTHSPKWISVRFSGLLQAYVRPIIEKIKYRI